MKLIRFKFLYLLITLSLLFINCQKDDEIITTPILEEVEAPKSLFSKRTLPLVDVPNVKNIVENSISARIRYSAKGVNEAKVILDTDEVIEIIDTLNNANYAIRFRFTDTPIGEFYNLVIGRTPEGILKTPFVLKYSCEYSSLDSYVNSGLDFNYFKGSMSVHKYTDFFALNTFSAGDPLCQTPLDEYGDPIACEVNPIDGNSGGGPENGDNSDGDGSDVSSGWGDSTTGDDGDNGDNGDDGDSSTDGSDDGGESEDNGLNWLCEHRNQLHNNPGDCNNPGEGGSWIIILSAKPDSKSAGEPITYSTYGNEDDCPPCPTDIDGGIGIVTPSPKSMKALLKECLNLSDEGNSYLGGTISDANLTTAYNYAISKTLLEECPNPDATSFLEHAIEAWKEGGEVDFDNEIILDPSFIGTKAECVYNRLVTTGLDNHNLMTSTFIAFSNGNYGGNQLIYKVAPNLVNSNGDSLSGQFHREGNKYIVTLNRDLLDNRSPLEIAKTILHESIHALLRRHYVIASDSFIDLFAEYIRNNIGSSDITHAIMRDYYINQMANTLGQYDSHQEDISVYEALSWEGLHQLLTQEELIDILEIREEVRNRGLNCN